MYSCHLFLISSASVRSIPFLSFTEPIFAWNVPLVSLIFVKRSLVFPFLLFSSVSLHWSLRKASLSLLAILWNSAFKWVYLSFSPLLFASLLFTAIGKASSDSHFAFLRFFFVCLFSFFSFFLAFLHFFFLGMVLLPSSCIVSQTSVHSLSSTLSDLVPSIYFPLPLYNHKGFDLGHTLMVVIFPTFFILSLNLAMSSWSEPQSALSLGFCWLYWASVSLAAKNIINLILECVI